MKTLVTGADGFIGSHLVEYLLDLGHEVKALVQYNSFNSWGWLDTSARKNDVEVIAGDIRDAYFCKQLLDGCDTVYNLAALIAIPYSYQSPGSYFDTNVKGSINLCQAALSRPLKKFIQTSTSEVYGSARYVPIDELHPLQAQSPYSASKIASDAAAMSFYHAFDLPLTIARPFNTYGPRQSARAVIPTIISQIASGIKKISLGDVSPTRDFNFVTDTCRGLTLLGDCQQAIGEVVNISSNYEISVEDVLYKIRDVMDPEVTFELDPQRLRPSGSEVVRLWGDNNKIKQMTGFEPQVNLELGLKKTIDWFTQGDNLAHYKSNQYNV